MAATKSGNHIYVDGTGNTLASITTDIGDTAFIEKTGVAPDIYTIKGNVARYLYIRPGGELTIGDPDDYSMNETLAFDQSVSALNRLYVQQGASLLQYGDTIIDFNTNANMANRSYYSYIDGKIIVQGNDTYKPVWQNYRRIYFYERQNNDTYTDDIWTFDKMIFGSSDIVNEYCLYFQTIGKVRNHSFTNIIWDKTYGRGYAMYPIYVPFGINGFSKVTFDNLNFSDVGMYPVYMNNASTQEYSNCTFGTTTSWKVYILGCYRVDTSQTRDSYGYCPSESYPQNFVFIHDCVFDSTGTLGVVYSNQGANILIKDCEWQHTAGDSIQVQNQGRVMMWTGNTFTGGREIYDLDFDGAVQWVHALDVTVKDTKGNPIDDATIKIVQSEGKESFLCRTNTDGKLINYFDINAILLTWKHQYGNTKATNFEYWSDSSNNTYHRISIYKAGYKTTSMDIIMGDNEQTFTVNLVEETDNHYFSRYIH